MRIPVVLLLLANDAAALTLQRPLPSMGMASNYGTGRCSHQLMLAKSKSAKSKTIQVILEADVAGLGEAGALVEVKPAYAENFIVAKGLGVKASKEQIASLRKQEEEAIAKAAANKRKALDAKDTMAKRYGKGGLVTEVQVADDGQLLVPVTSASIAAELKRGGVVVNAGDIQMPDVTELGSVVAELKLHPEVATSLKVTVERSKISIS